MEGMEMAEGGTNSPSPTLPPWRRALVWILGRWPYWITTLSFAILAAILLTGFLIHGGGYDPDHHDGANSVVADRDHREEFQGDVTNLIFQDPKQPKEKEHPVCNSKACMETAATFRTSMDTYYNPCHDFYKYACGNWRNSLTRQVDLHEYIDYVRLRHEDKMGQLRELLENIKPDEPEALQQLKLFYRSCVDLSSGSNGKADKERIGELLRSLFIPGNSLGKTMALVNRELGINLGFVVDGQPMPGLDIGTPSTEIVVYHLPTLHLTQEDCLGESSEAFQWYREQMTSLFDKYASQIFNLTEHHSSPTTSGNFAKIVAVEKRLAMAVTDPEERRKVGNAGQLSLKELNGLFRIRGEYSGVHHSQQQYEQINWVEYMETFWGDSHVVNNITEDFTVTVKDMKYVENVGRVFATLPADQLRLSLIGHILNKITQGTDLSTFREIPGVIEEICIKHLETNMGLAIAHKLLKTSMGNDTMIREASEMMSFIRQYFKSTLSHLDWMDPETKGAALRKLDDMKASFGHPQWLPDPAKLDEYYEGLKFSGSTYLQNMITMLRWKGVKRVQEFGLPTTTDTVWKYVSPSDISLAYHSSFNSLAMPTGILRFPYIGSGLSSIDYGALGMAMGHEVLHGFSLKNRLRDDTEMGKSSYRWTSSSKEKFKAKAQCLVEQYDRIWNSDGLYFTPTDIRGDGEMTNGERTLDENICDNGGLRLSFEAFKMDMNSTGEKGQRLPGLEEISPEQLFFLSFAHSYCSYTGWFAKDGNEGGSHSPKRIRVMGSLTNYEEFSRVWQCPEGSRMNPEEKCALWG